MPDPDAVIQNRDLTDDIVDSRLLDPDLSTETFTASVRFTGPYETEASGASVQRIEIESGKITGYTGDADEVTPGRIATQINGAGDSRTLQTVIWSPSFLDDNGDLFLVLRSASFDDSNSPPGLVLGHTGGSTQTVEFRLQNGVGLRIQGAGVGTFEGELVIPAVTSDPSSPADGNMWLHTSDNALYIWEGGARRTVASW